jgi:cyanophycinase
VQGTPFEKKMVELFEGGRLVLAGTSAGLQVFSALSLTGDPCEPSQRPWAQFETRQGFSLLGKEFVLDQHFLKRNRLQRLVTVCLEHEGSVGLGVDESTALKILFPSGRATVQGDSCVFYFDTRGACRGPKAVLDCRSGFVFEGEQLPFCVSREVGVSYAVS